MTLLTDFKGIVTAPGTLMRAEASCTIAQNAVLTAPGRLSKRKGFDRLANGTGGPIFKLSTSRLMGENALVHFGASLTGGVALRYGDGNSPLTLLNTVDSTDVTRPLDIKQAMAVSQRNHYLTSTEGVRRVQSNVTGTPVAFGGMPRGESPSLINFGFPGLLSGFGDALADGAARAYRVTWHKLDDDGVELGGPPTGRTTIRNINGYPGYPAGPAQALIYIPVPTEFGTASTQITTAYFWRLWGTRTWDAASGFAGDDECFLIAERYVTAPEIASGYIAYTDDTPDDFLINAPPLHTNQNTFGDGEAGLVQGISNADDPPPGCNTIAYWQDVMWFGDCWWRGSQALTLLSVSAGGTGLQDGDTVDVTGSDGTSVTLTARNVPALTTDFFLCTTLPTLALNIEVTVGCLVDRINANMPSLHAYQTATGGGYPGTFYLESAQNWFQSGSLPTNSGLFTCSRSDVFRPVAAGLIFESRQQANALCFSKPQRADAVPPVNLLAVGPLDARIIRIQPYRDRLIVFTDYGIYQVRGSTFADFSVTPLDLTYRLLARESVAVCDNKVYAWCFEGIVSIDENGVTVISTPIEPTVAAARAQSGDSTFSQLAFTTAYRQKHRVMFFYPQANDLTNLRGCDEWLVFDTRTHAWTTGAFTRASGSYNDNRSCGVTRWADDLLLLGNWNAGSTDAYLFLERTSGSATDYEDTLSTGAVVSVSFTASFQFQYLNPSGAMHWQQTVLQFDTDTPGPSTANATSITWATEWDNGTRSFSPGGARTIRGEPPQTCRRANRIQISIANTAVENFDLIGIDQTARPGAKFAKAT